MSKAQRKIASLESLGVEHIEMQLPSQQGTDEYVILQRPDLLSLIQHSDNGDAPDFLTAFITSQMGLNETTVTQQELLAGLAPMLATLATAAFVEPAISYEQAKRLSLQDKMFIMSWAVGSRFQHVNEVPPQSPNGVHPVPEA